MMSGEKVDDWTDADKAEWILTNGKPDVDWIFERVNNTVYMRPGQFSKNLPPWFSSERQELHTYEDNND